MTRVALALLAAALACSRSPAPRRDASAAPASAAPPAVREPTIAVGRDAPPAVVALLESRLRDPGGRPARVLPRDEILAIRLVGLAVEGDRAFAALAAGEVEEVAIAAPGDVVGTVDERCSPGPSMGWRGGLSRIRSELSAIAREMRELRSEDATTSEREQSIARRLAELEVRERDVRTRLEREEARHAAPAWCPRFDQSDALLWRVTAVDRDGVSLEAVRVDREGAGADGPVLAGVPPLRLRLGP
ncbi:MAG TPA: hypothetical protein VFU21_10515 [Kofleriaceae bacterium]|nr:hypothetical protein [Kofleriaceae bacterium]